MLDMSGNQAWAMWVLGQAMGDEIRQFKIHVNEAIRAPEASLWTRLVLDHAGFAKEHRDHLDAGWPRMYWEPLKKSLA